MDKLIPTWDDKYSINDERIDAQHRKLFELAAKVESAVYGFVKRDELKEILMELFNYMKEHFANEENYMYEISYPYLSDHKMMHKVIIDDMSYLIQHIKTTNDLKEKLYTIMSDWLLTHILRYDMMIGHWLNEQKNNEEEELEQTEENGEVVEKPKIIKKTRFIYTCPCHLTHILNYQEHLGISMHNRVLKCKNCKKDLTYVTTEIVEKRINNVSKMG
ncbi:bacteriohemerythrin [Campylobacter upsaliensis]|uniref:bacteriohemerythrin n=1 Tax=Campylobacter upsaliensis TaxID=28080 RepID=UPI00184190C3|nr:bacteriohemerythrin [Campylobacter upsaliensis]EAH5982327.1 hemerythrin family non-heme iron protein [Campylobacter upsaliensis]EHB2691974.1 bacteriohemerythrin [Campylobacter upsaliensis]EHQ1323398.1 bacteriohemerythrin [Campylobacter upsaliensis]EIO6375653.1 bacteriohemerythrin [Campylobacter upsaliensis]MEB2795594.1 bacteriohemerythrin [Campylobacter upsaliensis]